MEKIEEQMHKQREEVLESILAELKSRYKDDANFSCVIFVNDGKGTAAACYGLTIDLIYDITSIESGDKSLVKVKPLKRMLDVLKKLKSKF